MGFAAENAARELGGNVVAVRPAEMGIHNTEMGLQADFWKIMQWKWKHVSVEWVAANGLKEHLDTCS
jgi:hypothetical protein